MSLYVKGQREAPSQDFFTYAGFYSQQTAKEFTDTVIGLSKSGDIARKTLEIMERSSDTESIREINAALSVRKTAPQLVTLTIVKVDAEEAGKIVSALVRAVSEQVIELNEESGIQVKVASVGSTPIVEEQKPSVILNTLVVSLVGLTLSFVVISVKEYLKEEKLL